MCVCVCVCVCVWCVCIVCVCVCVCVCGVCDVCVVGGRGAIKRHTGMIGLITVLFVYTDSDIFK